MNIGVVGLGSMGKRRIRLLKQVDDSLNLIGIDSRADRREEVESLYRIKTFQDLKSSIKDTKLDAVVVSTSPHTHHHIIKEALENDCHVFTEINLVSDGYDENIQSAKEKGKVLFLSSTMMYRKEIEHINKKVKKSRNRTNYSYHVGQYLPTWHTWESYKDFFVAQKRTNGCRELFAIELPWIIKVFGRIESVKVESGNITTLDIDYPDNYQVIVNHENGVKGTISINVASIYAVRNLEVYGQDCYIKWGGKPDSLEEFDENEGVLKSVMLYERAESINRQNATIIEDAYEGELREFLGCINGECEARHSFERDREILDLIDLIEREI